MKAFKPVIERTVQDVSCVIKLDDGKDIIMCGEIVNGNVKTNVAPTFHQQKEFDALEEETRDKITALAYNNFRLI